MISPAVCETSCHHQLADEVLYETMDGTQVVCKVVRNLSADGTPHYELVAVRVDRDPNETFFVGKKFGFIGDRFGGAWLREA